MNIIHKPPVLLDFTSWILTHQKPAPAELLEFRLPSCDEAKDRAASYTRGVSHLRAHSVPPSLKASSCCFSLPRPTWMDA